MQLLSGGKRAPNRLVIGPAIFILQYQVNLQLLKEFLFR
jgi:hypothetical protein